MPKSQQHDIYVTSRRCVCKCAQVSLARISMKRLSMLIACNTLLWTLSRTLNILQYLPVHEVLVHQC